MVITRLRLLNMAQFTHRVNLANVGFPFVSRELGRTVLVSNNRNTPTNEASNQPEILYAHNVMPTVRGLTAVRYQASMDAITGADATTEMVRVLPMLSNYDTAVCSSGYRALIGLVDSATSKKIYMSRGTGSGVTWTLALNYASLYNYDKLSVATVNGRSFLFIANTVVYVIDHLTDLLVQVFPVGAPFAYSGLLDSHGYMIMWGCHSEIAWSSLINPLDFAPSTITGAGNGNVEGLKGRINFCIPTANGFLIFSDDNIVEAIYTGNKQFPFKFVPVRGSLGNDTVELVTKDTDADRHYSYSQMGGLTAIASSKAELILPEVTDFLETGFFEDYDTTTDTFTYTGIESANLRKKLTLVANRYLVISYGDIFDADVNLVNYMTHAIIYDLSLKKIGKIKYNHTAVFEDFTRSPRGSYAHSRNNIGLLSNDGKVVRLGFNESNTTRDGVLILGKYQYVRDRHLVLQKVELETFDTKVLPFGSFTCKDLPSLNGASFETAVEGTETITELADLHIHSFAFQSSAKNHGIVFIGDFDLTTIELLFTIGGRR